MTGAVQVVVVLAVLLAGIGFLLLIATLVRRRAPGMAGPSGVRVVRAPSEAPAPPPPPAIAMPVPDSPEVRVGRRMFLNRVWLLAMTVFGVVFSGGTLAFMWPNKLTGFGSKITVGQLSELKKQIESERRPYYNPEGRFYLVKYESTDASNPYVAAGVVKEGLMALYQKCAHLGCRVPFCETSQWFECPCHGSKYNIAGEVQPGSPAPAGLWRFPIEIEGGVITVDTSKPTAQPAFGADSIAQPPSGAHCIAQAEGA